jgi:hypothetical protein
LFHDQPAVATEYVIVTDVCGRGDWTLGQQADGNNGCSFQYAGPARADSFSGG